MPDTNMLGGSVDLDILAEFLAQTAETGGMTLSELDGYLAGVVASPTVLMPSAWLEPIWGDDGAPFASLEQAGRITSAIVRRYNEIIRQSAEGPTAYRPVIATGEARAQSAIDWGIGFMRAFAFEPEAWLGAMQDKNGMACLTPILALAAEMPMSIDVSEFRLPEADLRKLVEGAEALLPICVCGLRIVWSQRAERKAARQAKRPKPVRKARRTAA